jgi:hypothetical protein
MRRRRALPFVVAPLVLVACASGDDAGSAGDTSVTGDTDAAIADSLLRDEAPSDTFVVDGRGDTLGDASETKPPPPTVAQVTATSGWQIFPGGGYRYGPSIIVDGADIHMWTCSPGASGAWDYVRYRKSTDGGHTWSADENAIVPTPGSRDAFSACDPGAIRIGAYWYVGYTSTEDSRGTNNQLYLARASSPNGPYEKWNGTGWGGNPQPIVTYSGDASKYGIGEPSLVLKDKLYVFYSYVDAGNQTDLSIADDPTDPNWPAHLVSKGHVITRRPNAEDSTDVKWADALGRFVAVCTYDRFGPNATIGVYQSYDGLVFEPTPFRGARVQPGAHNAGISGTPAGHLDVAKSNFVAYAYQPPGKSWGDWPTFVDPVTITLVPPGPAVGGAVSSLVGDDWGWSGPRAWDGDPATLWSSTSHGATADASESIVIDLGRSLTVTGVAITPRAAGLAFPLDFRIEAATTADAFTLVPGETHVGYPKPTAPVTLTFASKLTARWLRLTATKLGTDDFANHYLQLAELAAIVEAP